ncbi:MAG: dihydrofolate reductase [Bacteroidales bacterium]|nr:dihydrofolate reductase [Bacteroidales bacterium]MCF8458527.1 dihydrofolate reductase [Bacteroidales bacterium]
MKKQISLIVAVAENYAIGLNNDLLWHISDDLKRFKKLTTGNVIIMGKRTFHSLPNGALPNRENMVITDVPDEQIEGCTMAYSIDDAIEKMSSEKENFIIGGGMVYKQFLPLANKLYLTRVHANFEADTFFPEINFDEWTTLESEKVKAGGKNEFAHTYMELERK